MEESKRLLIAIALAGLILFGWQFMLQKTGLEKHAAPPAPAAQAPAPAGSPAASAPANGAASASAAAVPGTAAPGGMSFVNAPPESLVSIETPTWRVVLSSRGARPIHWVVKDFRRGDKLPLELIPEGSGLERLALRRGGAQFDFTEAPFEVVENRQDGPNHLVTFRAREASGNSLSVHYRFPDTAYVCGVQYTVENPRSEDRVLVQWRAWRFNTETNQRDDLMQARVSTLMGEELAQDRIQSGFNLLALFNPDADKSFKKHPEMVHTGNVEWTILRSKYFALGFLFPPQTLSGVTSLGNPDSMRLGVRFEYPLLGRNTAGYEMYVGPVDFWKLQPAGHNLTRLVDSGFKLLVPLNRVVLKFFTLTHKVVPNYGLVIIVLSVVMRLVFWPLSQTQMRSMQKMQQLQPVMDRLREKYKNDPERMNKEIFALYKEHKVNPMGGCLPILVQMPVFFALYNVLSSSIELRQAGFVAWITDLSAPDVLRIAGFSVHVLPLIMAITMYWQQKLTPMDPRQAATAMMMPFVMLFIFYGMPSGLVLYWTTINILTALQQMQTRPGPKPGTAVTA